VVAKYVSTCTRTQHPHARNLQPAKRLIHHGLQMYVIHRQHANLVYNMITASCSSSVVHDTRLPPNDLQLVLAVEYVAAVL
jgi:hypothetical protein